MMNQLKKEEQQKKNSLESKIEQMNQEIKSLSDTIKNISKELESEDIKFLKVRSPIYQTFIHSLSIHPNPVQSCYLVMLTLHMRS